MDILSLCAQVQSRREHVAFLKKCEEEYLEDQVMTDSPSEEEEVEEEEPRVQHLNVRWYDVFTAALPRNQNAFQPIDPDEFAMLLVRQTLHRCMQEHVTESEARALLFHTWQTCESEKEGFMQAYKYKRITWAATFAMDLIFVFK